MNLNPTDWKLARLHASTFNPGFSKEGSSQTCPCCSVIVEEEEIPMSENTKQLSILGPGFPLYFIFLKYSIIMIFLLVVSYSTLTLYWAYDHNNSFCMQSEPKIGKDGTLIHCTSWMILYSRLESHVDINQNILRITSFMTQLFFLLYIREQLRKYNAYFHQQQQPKVSDYSLLIKNIPKQSKIKQRIQVFFQNAFGGRFTIENIHPIAYLEDSISNHAQLQTLQKKHLVQVAKENRNQDKIKLIVKKFNNLWDEEQKKSAQCSQKIERDEVECQKAIVTVSTEKDKEAILKEIVGKEVKVEVFGIGAEGIEIVAAPEPDQIIWSNINVPRSTKVKSIIIGWSLFIVLLAVVTVIFYFLLSIKAKEIEQSMAIYKEDPTGATNLKMEALAIVLSCVISIILFNKLLLSKLLHIITEFQRHKTAAGFELSLSIKYALGLVFTTAILTLLVENIKFHNIYEHDYGVIEEETIMYFFSAFFIPFIWLSNPWYICKTIKMYIFYKSMRLSQKEANELMELPEYNIGKRYAEIMEMVWFTYFYASLIPVGALLALIGIGLFYWVDKYNLLRKSSVKQNISGDLSMKALIMLDFTLILKPVGEIVFDLQIRSEWNYQSICLIAVGILYIVLPKNRLLDWINGQNFKLNIENYKQIEIENSRLHTYSYLRPAKAAQYSQIRITVPPKSQSPEDYPEQGTFNSIGGRQCPEVDE